jgi:hypothetical protein
VSLGAGVAAHTCGGKDHAVLTVQYTKIAAAIAKAIAATYVECVTTGVNVYGEAEAYAHAKASAEAYATALGHGFASIETCFGCKAAAELLVTSSKKLFAKAMADSHSKVLMPTLTSSLGSPRHLSILQQTVPLLYIFVCVAQQNPRH